MPTRIADRETNCLGPDIETGELSAGRESSLEFRHARSDYRRQAASLLSASRLIAPQKSA